MLYRHATTLFCPLSLWQCMMICHQLVCSSLHSARLFPSLSPGHLDSGRFEMPLTKISFSWPVPYMCFLPQTYSFTKYKMTVLSNLYTFLFFLSQLSFPPFHIPLHQLESNGNDSITYRWRGSVVWNDRWKFYDISGTGCHMMPSLGKSAPFSELQSFWLVLLFSFLFSWHRCYANKLALTWTICICCTKLLRVVRLHSPKDTIEPFSSGGYAAFVGLCCISIKWA